MIQLANKLHYQLCRKIVQTTFINLKTLNAHLIINRHKSTNRQNSHNIQEAALKLDPSKKLECPQPASGSSIPPPKNDFAKYVIVGGAIAGSVAGYMYYKNSFQDSENNRKRESDKEPKKKEKFRSPENLKNIPKHIPYLLIGGGTASFAAFRAIKSNDAKAKILVVSEEHTMPYMRPPLSKEIWFDTQLGVEKARFKQWNGAERSLYYEPEEFYFPAEKLDESVNGGVSIIRGYSVAKLNVNEQKIELDDGTEITYDKCLLATGSIPKKLSVFDRASPKIKEKISTYKTIKDFETVKQQVENAKTVAIVGNGFLGSELACALFQYGQEKNLKVYQLFPENGNMAKILPSYLSQWTSERMKSIGIDVMPESQIINVEIFNGNQLKINLNNGTNVIVDFIIQAVGSEPNIELAKNASLEIDPKLNGFVVNAELEARSNLYVAGDVACFYDPRLGRRRVEHHDHAVVSGRLAGENMVGLKKPYKHQSMFWSDLGSAIGFEAIGLIDSSLPTIAIFAQYTPTTDIDDNNKIKSNDSSNDTLKLKTNSNEEASKVQTDSLSSDSLKNENYGKGVVFYMNNERIVGILLWNVFNRISIARKILSSEETFSDLNEVAKLFDIFEQHHQEKEN